METLVKTKVINTDGSTIAFGDSSRLTELLRAIWQSRIAYVFIFPAMLVMGVLVIYPLVRGIFYSFTDMNQFNMGNAFAPSSFSFVGLKNYLEVFFGEDTKLYPVLRQSLIFTFISVFFHVTIGLGLALIINQKLRGRLLFRTLLLIPWAVPSFVSAFSWRWLFNSEYGFFNLLMKKFGLTPIEWLSDPFWAMFAVITTNIWLGFPFMMVAFLGGLQGIPDSLYEAAKVDGAGSFRRFVHVTLPMLRPVVFTVTLLGIIWTFNLFHVIYLVTGGGPYGKTDILPTFTYMEAFQRWEFGYAATYGVVILSLLIVFTSIYTRIVKQKI